MASLSVTVGHNQSEIGEALANNNDLYFYANWVCTKLKQSRRCEKKIKADKRGYSGYLKANMTRFMRSQSSWRKNWQKSKFTSHEPIEG